MAKNGLGYDPTLNEIADHHGVTRDRVLEVCKELEVPVKDGRIIANYKQLERVEQKCAWGPPHYK